MVGSRRGTLLDRDQRGVNMHLVSAASLTRHLAIVRRSVDAEFMASDGSNFNNRTASLKKASSTPEPTRTSAAANLNLDRRRARTGAAFCNDRNKFGGWNAVVRGLIGFEFPCPRGCRRRTAPAEAAPVERRRQTPAPPDAPLKIMFESATCQKFPSS
jgi:hypothetical protein